MKILHINCNYIGTTLHQKMIETLSDKGVKNIVFVPTYNKNLSVIDINRNVIVSECFNRIDRAVFYYKQHKIIKAIEQHVKASDFDCIHAYTLFTDGNCAMKLYEKYNIPYVVAVRNTDVNTFLKKVPFLRRRGLKIMEKASAIFFLSESYRKEVFDKYVPYKKKNKLFEKTYIIPNGIDEFWFDNVFKNNKNISNLLNKNEIHLIYVGNVSKLKNILTTQKAMKILRKKGIKTTLTIVGKIRDKRYFKRIQKDQYTTYFSAKPKEEIKKLLRKHDIFIMPSFTETFGLVYAEAMSQGLPVIYSKGQGFDEQFTDGKVGFHVNAYSPKDVADGIEKVLANYEQIIINLENCVKKFNWEIIVFDYIRIYNQIVFDHNKKEL